MRSSSGTPTSPSKRSCSRMSSWKRHLRDRTVKIDVPYVTRLSDEIQIPREGLQRSRKVRGKKIAPHTLEVAAMWAILTRLEEPKNAGLTLMQKLKLYNGKTLPGFTEDNIKELREEAEREGMHGISPRYVQDKISNALVALRRRAFGQPVHGPQRARDRPEAPLTHQQRGDPQALQASAGRRQGGVRGYRQERGPATRSPPTRRQL